jgi:murein hydrolase activator
MRRARRNSLLVLLLLTAQAASGSSLGAGPVDTGRADTGRADTGRAEAAGVGPPRLNREDTARRRVEDSNRMRSLQADAQREATEQAAQALAEEKRLTAEQSEAFERLKSAEAAVREMTAHMRELNQQRAESQDRIDKRVETLRPLLPVILRLSAYPVETLLATQVPIEDAVRGILVVKAMARQAETDSRALVADREALDATTRAAAEVARQLAAAEAERSSEAASLAQQLAETKRRREIAEQDAAAAARQAAAEAARATSLLSMLQILETQRQLQEARAREDELKAERDQKVNEAEAARLRQAATARPTGAGTLTADAKPGGQVTPPITGMLVRNWGDADSGEPATGQSWQSEPGARVLAPCGGTVAFAEPFRDYGPLVIIDCGGGYHAVLSGMGQLAVVPGRPIRNGDVVGTMPAATKTATVGAPPKIGPPILYFELRKGGHPIDPGPWIGPPGDIYRPSTNG